MSKPILSNAKAPFCEACKDAAAVPLMAERVRADRAEAQLFEVNRLVQELYDGRGGMPKWAEQILFDWAWRHNRSR